MLPIFGDRSNLERTDEEDGWARRAHSHQIRRRVLAIFLFLPLIIFAVAISRDPKFQLGWTKSISTYAKDYLLFLTPGVFLHLLNEIQWRLYSDFGYYYTPIIFKVLSVSLHPMWCWYFCYLWGKNVTGIGMASAVTNAIFLASTVAASFWYEDLRAADLDTMMMFNPPSFDKDLVYKLLDYWGLVQMMLAAGYVNPLSFAAQTVLMINALILSGIGQGMSHTIHSNLSVALQCLTQNQAHTFMSNILCFAAVIGLVSSILVSVLMPKIMYKVSSDIELVDKLNNESYYFTIAMAAEIFRTSLMGVLKLKNETIRALGLHAGFTIVIIPLALQIIVFDCEMGLEGVWLAKLIAEALELALYLVAAGKAEWGEGYAGSLFVAPEIDLRRSQVEQAELDEDGSAVYDENSIEMGTFRSHVSKVLD